MIFTRQQHIRLLKHKINTVFGRDASTRKKTVPIASFCNPNNAKYDKEFIRIILSGMKFAGISNNSYDIKPEQIEALINFFQVCSWTDFYIVFRLFPIMPVIIMVIQLLTFITLLTKFI